MPNAVTRPPRGTMTRFARMPVTEARLKWKARMGSTPRDAAAEATRDVRSHRHGLAMWLRSHRSTATRMAPGAAKVSWKPAAKREGGFHKGRMEPGQASVL